MFMPPWAKPASVMMRFCSGRLVLTPSTTRPAAVLGRAGELGTLRVGSIADVALLEKREGRFVFTDSYRQDRVGRELLVAAATIRGGELVPGGGGLRMRRLPSE